MIEFKRILHPTDFSDSGSAALSAACELATRFGAELHLLHVVQDVASIAAYGIAETYLPPEWREEIRQQAEKALQKLPPPALAGSLKIVRAIAEGGPYFEIVEYAKQRAIDLIVMGTHGRTGLPHVFLGSVAERVVREAPCAVLTIRP
jgi:nucleotide-binding universal stress UspA family protein